MNPKWGVVKKVIADRGFGFISMGGAEAREKDVFFHSKSVVGLTFDELHEGDVVDFEIEEGEKGIAAVNVQRNGGARRYDELKVLNSDALEPPSATEPVEIPLIKAITDEVVRCLSRHPSDLYQLHPKMFEELIAEIFMSEGYTTELVRSWNQADGGVDIVALRRDIGGVDVRYVIQCKRHAADRRITAEPIRALAGVMDRFRAHVGVVATTSYFTKPAKDEVEHHLWKINLRDYENIVAALKRLDFLRRAG